MNAGTMINMCLRRLGGIPSTQTRTTDHILEELNAAYDWVEAEREWDWMEKGQTFPITATTTRITLPTDCAGVCEVVLESTGAALPHKNIHLEEIDYGALGYQGRASGLYTRAWDAFWDDGGKYLQIIPYPGAVDNVIVKMLVEHTPLVTAVDAPIFPARFHQILVNKAMSVLSAQATIGGYTGNVHYREAIDMLRKMKCQCGIAKPTVKALAVLAGQFGNSA